MPIGHTGKCWRFYNLRWGGFSRRHGECWKRVVTVHTLACLEVSNPSCVTSERPHANRSSFLSNPDGPAQRLIRISKVKRRKKAKEMTKKRNGLFGRRTDGRRCGHTRTPARRQTNEFIDSAAAAGASARPTATNDDRQRSCNATPHRPQRVPV